MTERFKKFSYWFRKFFDSDTRESMMRMIVFLCGINGIGIIWYCTATETQGFAHHGEWLVGFAILGKGFQDYNKRKKLENNTKTK